MPRGSRGAGSDPSYRIPGCRQDCGAGKRITGGLQDFPQEEELEYPNKGRVVNGGTRVDPKQPPSPPQGLGSSCRGSKPFPGSPPSSQSQGLLLCGLYRSNMGRWAQLPPLCLLGVSVRSSSNGLLQPDGQREEVRWGFRMSWRGVSLEVGVEVEVQCPAAAL